MIEPEVAEKLQKLKGVVATVVTSGMVDESFSEAFSHVRSFCDRNGFHNIEWRRFSGVLVEAGRDNVAHHALQEGYDWLIQIDADAAPIPQDVVPRLLHAAYVQVPDADVVGAYCQLKNYPFLPTIDTGTGTWEPHYPESGILPVIRTGGHCFVAKTQAFKRFPAPWFKTRAVMPPAHAFAEVDNFARTRRDGKNPLRGDDWESLVLAAQEAAPKGPAHMVGEDSGFCDGLTAAGGSIYVDTSIVVGHVTKKVLKPNDMKEALAEQETARKLRCGILSG